LLGGREIHPVNIRVGGFYRVPDPKELLPIKEQLKRARDLAVDTLRWVATFSFPDYERDYGFVALRHADEYAITEGRIVSNRGLDIEVSDYGSEFEEHHVAHSTSLQSVLKRHGSYLVGPMARYSLNFDRLPPDVQALAREAGLGPVCRNPFQSIVVRAVELVYACDEALRIIAAYRKPDAPAVLLQPRAAVGHGSTEAPRGLIYHRYEIADDGSVRSAHIVPPTSQNQLCIEEDLCAVATLALDLPDDALRDRCEQAIRNYDPCISCSCHFLKLAVHRT
jgi:coenzyme F420-reducing hydrogenase alpha subunit